MSPLVALWALPLAPAAAALAGFLLPLKAKRTASLLAVAGVAAAVLALVLVYTTGGLSSVDGDETRFISDGPALVRFGSVAVTLSVGMSQLTWWVGLVVVVVALMVQVYSIGYLRADDERYNPYAAQISLFTAAMLLVVVADDLVLLMIGWEVMGACSYLLIGHDRKLPQAPAAAVKAFLVTRVADVAFLIGVLMLGFHIGSFRVDAIAEYALENGHSTMLTVSAVLIMIGAFGKSAQFPLHTWLPDAMAGPTPISALIHAATMVAAGAYVLVRLSQLLFTAGTATFLQIVAVVSMVVAALAALATDDLKRVLAWSTVSQVAYMMAAAGIGAWDESIFYLVGHGFFKALLFLTAGAVIHMTGTNSMSAMGGLRKGAPVTFWTMTIGFAALIGLPPLTGFYAKEHVLSHAYGHEHLVFYGGLATALLTAAYATRAWLRTFFGAPRGEAHAHDPNPWMLWPLLILAVPTVALGAVMSFLPSPPIGAGAADPTAMGLTMTAIAVGIGLAWGIWRTDKAADPARVLGPLGPVFEQAGYVNQIQDALIVTPVRFLATVARRSDESLVDGAAEGAGKGIGLLGRAVALTHRAGMPRHVLSVLAGALLIGAAAVVIGVWG
ncbi:NADH dehydrogenase [Actinorhabdospora filicis]|uniref:NADH dehydrogenase n=1 Tax=Actinorhabdospora filicis TaxID=1785913 RepID=A0A9W6SPV7_9ACTN|nr:NADH-quinone oxidoreductase subunit L [Actinorhabdospora filicis]GLZ80785.1 NADH dehydrogenase [Actinorhabdospora filicis]